MRIANLNGRAVLVDAEELAHDLERASAGRFGPDAASLFEQWDDLVAWADSAQLTGGEPIDHAQLDAPSPAPRQILAVGLNYAEHAKESGFDAPELLPPVFPKFPSALAGPETTVVMPVGSNMDWEIELVAVIGRRTVGKVAVEDAWHHVAGLTAGQDISDRATQFSTPAPQFGLGKSFPGFAPTGPWIVTPDEFPDADALGLRCTLDGETMQDGNTRDMLFDVAHLVSELSGIVTLHPGDLIFTGTPAGVGLGREPKVFIKPGQVLESEIDGIGTLRQTFVDRDENGHAPHAQVLR